VARSVWLDDDDVSTRLLILHDENMTPQIAGRDASRPTVRRALRQTDAYTQA